MNTIQDSVRVGVIQASPVFMDLKGSIEKVRTLTSEAAKKGVELVLFPEAYIPGYPRGLSFGMKIGNSNEEGREDWLRYWNNSVSLLSEAIDKLSQIARENEVFLVIGLIEKEHNSRTLYCTVLYFGPNGELLGKHRKLKATGSERLIWGEGDGSTLPVFDMPYGKVGSLICWENYMPLARASMYSKGVNIYLAPTADQSDTWQSTIQHIALEGRCFVLSCNQYVTKEMYPKDLSCYSDLESEPDVICRGGSAIVSPTGEYIVEPVYGREDILVADLDLNLITKSKLNFDVNGHYARPDVFQLVVNTNKQSNIIKSSKI